MALFKVRAVPEAWRGVRGEAEPERARRSGVCGGEAEGAVVIELDGEFDPGSG